MAVKTKELISEVENRAIIIVALCVPRRGCRAQASDSIFYPYPQSINQSIST